MSERWRAMFPWDELVIGARLLWRLPTFLRRPVSAADARATVRRRLERRQADFLGLSE